MLSDRDLILLIQQGFFPGEEETEEEFLKRVRFFKSQEKENVLPQLNRVFDLQIDWLKVDYRKDLPFWIGAMTEVSSSNVCVTVSKRWEKREKWFLYKKEEVLAHEAIHAMRMAFKDASFEELLAYQTAFSSFRRYWGPLFRTPTESRLLLWGGLIAMLGIYFSLLPSVFGLVPLAGFTLLIGRLVLQQKRFSRLLEKFQINHISKQKALKILLGLTDKEWKDLLKVNPESLAHFFSRDNGSLRDRALKQLYFHG